MLSSERLKLTPLHRRDSRELHDAIVETLPDLIQWLPWAHTEHSRMDTRHYVYSARLSRAHRQNFELLVRETASGEVLGLASLHRIDWVRRVAGLGYWIRRSAWGKGYAPEAAAVLVEHGFRVLGLHRIEAHVALDNFASQRVAQKLGFEREGIAREFEFVNGRFLDHIQYSVISWEGASRRARD